MDTFSRKVTNLNENETFQSAMTYEEDQKLILNTEKKISFEEGVEQGVDQRNIEIAKSMLKDNVPIESIIKYTNLTLKQISELNSN